MPGLFIPAPLGGRFPLSPLRWKRIVGNGKGSGSLQNLRVWRLRDSRNDFREHPQAINVVVQGYVVDHVAQDRSQRSGDAEGARLG